MIICHLATDPKSLAKVRTEFNSLIDKELKETVQEKPSNKQDLLKKYVTFDNL